MFSNALRGKRISRNKKPHECGVLYRHINLYDYFLTVTFLLVIKLLVNPDITMSMKST